MVKALLRKQLLEIGNMYFPKSKNGKVRSKAGNIGFIVLYIFLFGVLGFSFYMIASLFAEAMIPMGYTWLYFAIMGMLAFFIGVFGSVFNTYAGLYRAKDNELLLSMPIKPIYILSIRTFGIYVVSIVFESLIFVPTIIAYFIYGTPSVLSAINCILLLFVIGFLIVTVSCILGWIVALIATKLKNRSLVTVFIYLVLFGGYYYLCFNYGAAIQSVLVNIITIGSTVKGSVYPLYLLGRAAEGDALSMLIFTSAVLAILGVTFYVLSKTFIRIATVRDTAPKAEYKEKPMKESSVEKALFRKELKRFISSPTYMMNCSLGTVFMTILGIAAVIFASDIRDIISLIPVKPDVIYVIAAAAVCSIVSMNDLTAPSVSLEGKSISLIQSMPVDPELILNAKQRLHYVMTAPAALILSLCLCWVLGADAINSVALTLVAIAFMTLSSALGLMINLKKPNLDWTNETAPVKQSVGVAICLFGGWIVSLAIGVGGYFITKYVSSAVFLFITAAILLIATRIINSWLRTKGADIFARL